MLEKILELVFSFDQAPKELQDQAKKTRDLLVALNKAEAQAAIWRKEREAAKAAYAESSDEFQKVLDAWKPTSEVKEER